MRVLVVYIQMQWMSLFVRRGHRGNIPSQNVCTSVPGMNDVIQGHRHPRRVREKYPGFCPLFPNANLIQNTHSYNILYTYSYIYQLINAYLSN